MRRDDPGPYSLDVLAALPAPRLFTTDAATLKARYVAWFESETGRTLYPMQVEMLMIETLAYAMSLLGEEGQLAVEEALVAQASISGLEALGPNRSTPRLPASPARVTLEFSIEAAGAAAVLVPAGTRVSAGSIAFATNETVVIAPGATAALVGATAVSPGSEANGLFPGQIATVMDPVAGAAVAVTNTTESSGGADAEAPELYRLRLANAFERVSTGGSFAWYRETAIGVSPAIIDVAIVRPQPCIIDIYPLTLGGAAGVDLRNQVLETFNTGEALDIRFGDDVFVKPPVAVTGAPVLTVRGRGMASTIQADAMAAAQGVLKVWRERLGAAVAPSDIEAAVKSLTGVVDAEVSGIAFLQLQRFEFFVATSLTVNIVVLP